MVKQADGSFEVSVPIPFVQEKVLYKYVVDDVWLVSGDQKITTDDAGNENNYLENEDLVQASQHGSKIPESGGGFVAASNKSSEANGSGSELKTTVMPVGETEHHNQNTLGEAGIFIPKDEEQLKAFEQVRDVDPKTLNEDSESEKTKKVKRSEVKAKKLPDSTSNEASKEEESGLNQKDKELAVIAATTAVSKGPEQIEHESKNVEQSGKDKNEEPKEDEKHSSAVPLAGAAAVGTAGSAGVIAASATHKQPEPSIPQHKEAEPVHESKQVEPLVPDHSDPAVVKGSDVKHDIEPLAPQETDPVVVKDTPKTLDPKAVEPEADVSEVVATPVADVPIKSIDDDSVPVKEEEIVIADGHIPAEEIEHEVKAKEGSDVTLEEFKPSKAEVEQLVNANVAPPAADSKPETKASKISTTKDTKQKKPNALKRFFKKVFD